MTHEPLLPPKPSVKAPANFTPPEELYKELVASVKKYHPSGDLTLIEKAYQVAKDSHGDQKRKSGEPYIIHPLCVGIILAELELDKESIAAGLLHDVIEDTTMTFDEVASIFGKEVAFLVDGVTKLTQINWDMDKIEIQAENLRKMFLAMAKDIRVILVKLADRLHNMRTSEFWKPETQKQKARETLEIYSPLASRLGISKIKTELDDLSLMLLEPDVYRELTEKLYSTQEVREKFIAEIIDEVKVGLEASEIKAELSGRVKHLFSIYRKMVNQDKTLDQIYDIFAVRIIVDSVRDCYAALGVIHEMYHPITVRFKDYIAMPKPNMYQSLHTTLIAKNGQPFEIQIRTYEMHRTAEYGIAAHWKYKERGSGDTTVHDEEAKLSWLRQILEWQKDVDDNREFVSMVKTDLNLFSDTVYCFTPSGDVKNLPSGSTPIDFAYSIHSAVGNRMVGAKVNDKLVPIDYKIQNGDRIEIITSQNSRGPSRDWLNIIKSSQAKNKINQWFKQERKEDNILRGKELVSSCAKSKGYEVGTLTKPEFRKKVIAKYGFRDWESVLAAVGHGGLKEGQIVNKLIDLYQESIKKNITDAQVLAAAEEAKEKPAKIRSKNGIVVKGVDDVAVRFSRCCAPVPGDEIVGFVTRGRGISIHRTDCVNMMTLPDSEKVRLIDAEWQRESLSSAEKFMADIKIFCNNRIGMVVDISKVLTERQIDISSMNSKTSKQGTATINMSFDIGSVDELNQLIQRLRAIPGVIDIERATG
ncbi:MAG: bifunctional (p)ppGpp synthetase/guanosine-3',5'-bis(diphosphate) 3'-pyrophosphohydrolase [Lachnospiraceae bacterium]|nr:bifunctional (p)ppGpp synthetase/guanosine-3',5'-bis(diphosphate) 3'-pyrophosphohydrolase [Lachnospiraceae bacterium]